MNYSSAMAWAVLAVVSMRWLAQLWLERINARHVQAHAAEIPAPFRHLIDSETYRKSVEYTLAKSRFHRLELTWDFLILMLLLAPSIIMPLFNKFTPLPEGSLRDRLLALGARTGFQAKTIQIMDGSKRSRHSNAFFTGFGRFRKIVLFDTLVQQLSEPELEAVLAHEIGHYKKRHIPKMLIGAAVVMLLGFFVLAQLARQDRFYRAFGFMPGELGPALLLFALLSGVVTFWFSPLGRYWSRRYEYQADDYAAKT